MCRWPSLAFLKAVLSMRALWAASLFLALFLFSAFIQNYPATEMGLSYDIERVAEIAEFEIVGTGEGLDPGLQDTYRQREPLRQDVIAAASADAQIDALAALRLFDARTLLPVWPGAMASDYAQRSLWASSYEALARLEDRQVVSRVREVPASLYLVYQATWLPAVYWALPAAVAVFAVGRLTNRGRLLAQQPMHPLSMFFRSLFLAFLVALLLMAVAVVPIALTLTMLNGWGNPAYPVFSIVEGHIERLTVGAALVRLSVLWCALTAFVVALGSLARSCGANGLVCAIVCVVPALCSQVPLDGESMVTPWLPIAYLEPMAHITYFDFMSLAPGGQELLKLPGTTWDQGVLAFLLWSLVLNAAGVGVVVVRQAVGKWRAGRIGAHAAMGEAGASC